MYSLTYLLILNILIVPSIKAENNYEIQKFCNNFENYKQCIDDFKLNNSKTLIKTNAPIRIPVINYK